MNFLENIFHEYVRKHINKHGRSSHSPEFFYGHNKISKHFHNKLRCQPTIGQNKMKNIYIYIYMLDVVVSLDFLAY